jgi:hypothetical protein
MNVKPVKPCCFHGRSSPNEWLNAVRALALIGPIDNHKPNRVMSVTLIVSGSYEARADPEPFGVQLARFDV